MVNWQFGSQVFWIPTVYMPWLSILNYHLGSKSPGNLTYWRNEYPPWNKQSATENWWLGDEISLWGLAYFQGAILVSGRIYLCELQFFVDFTPKEWIDCCEIRLVVVGAYCRRIHSGADTIPHPTEVLFWTRIYSRYISYVLKKPKATTLISFFQRKKIVSIQQCNPTSIPQRNDCLSQISMFLYKPYRYWNDDT